MCADDLVLRMSCLQPTCCGCCTPLVQTDVVTKRLHGVQVSGEKEFFSEMVVDAVKHLDPQTLDLAMLGIKKVTLWYWAAAACDVMNKTETRKLAILGMRNVPPPR